jgi:ankyrin repeat protein
VNSKNSDLIEIFDYLLQKGANPNKKIRNKHLIEIAAINQNTPLVKSFLDTQQQEILNLFSSNCLHLIVQNNDLDSLQKFFSFQQIEINKKDKFSKTLLDYVVEEENINFLDLVLERKADPNLFDRDGIFS